MKTSILALVLSAVVIMFAGYLSADDNGFVCPLDKKTAKKMMDEDHAKRVAYYTTLLNLTPDQSKKISDIMVEYRDRQLAKKDEFIQSQVDAVNESDRKIKAVLTPEQVDKYKEAQSNQNKTLGDKMRDWFQSGMCY